MTSKITQKAFDRIAASYDQDFGANPVGLKLRERCHLLFKKYFQSPGLLWDAGCGSGLDALALARSGYRIVATDQATAMLAEVVKKIEQNQLHDSIMTIQKALDSPDLGRLLREVGPISGIYSNFGALNCLENLVTFARTCASLLPKDAFLVLIYMGRFSPLESLYYLLKAKPGPMIRRFSSSSQTARLGNCAIPIRYYSSANMYSYFRPFFSIIEIVPLGIILPPPFLFPCPALEKHIDWLDRWDRLIATCKLCREWGDHTALVLQRNDNELPHET